MRENGNRPQLGQSIIATARMIKQSGYVGGVGYCEWVRKPTIPMLKGIYAGYRHVKPGTWKWADFGGPDEHRYFAPKEQLLVWLLIPDERTNPIHCLPSDCQWEE